MYSVVASAVNHPDMVRPCSGLFNYRSLSALAEKVSQLEVVVPRPFVPPAGPYSELSELPTSGNWGSYRIHHPRFFYFLPKRLVYSLSGRSFASRVPAYVERAVDTPDVVHACHIYLDGYGMLPYCRDHDVPLTIVAHGTLLNSYDELPPFVRSKVRETLAHCSRVLCVSDALAEKAATLVSPKKVVTVPLGADPDKFPVDCRRQIRSELGVADQRTLILFVGAFTRQKGVDEIISLLSRLDVPDLAFAFIGHAGDRRWDLTQALRKSRYPSRHVYWQLSPVAVRRWFAAADLLLLPSHTEGRPTVIYEAMASETAVLASDVGGIPEQVSDGETGRLIPSRDLDSLEAALVSLVADRDRLRHMGKRGRERLVAKGWTWDAHAARVNEHHRDLIE